MKDGFYLSAYVQIDELFNIYQKSLRHDQNISLWEKKGSEIKLVHYWELERITGYKQHDKAFYSKDDFEFFVNGLLATYDITLEDIEEIWGMPEYEEVESAELPFSYHSLYHLFSSVLLDSDLFFHNQVIGLALDGYPDYISHNDLENEFYCSCYISNGEIKYSTACSPGLLWQICSKHFRLREGSLMALATASKSELINYNYELLEIKNDNSIKGVNAFIKNLKSYVFSLNENDEGDKFNLFDPCFTIEENRISMIMKIIQDMSLRMVELDIDNLVSKYKIDTKTCYLSLSGGFSLNCPTNSYVMNKYGFKGLLVPPVVNDGGLSMGIALYHFYKAIGYFRFKFGNPYYGDKDDKKTLSVIRDDYIKYIEKIEKLNLNQAVNDIISGPIIWIDDRSEIGPRALGHRSIIADPRTIESKNRINEVKGREWWRPVAPIVLESKIADFFEDSSPSPYMLQTYYVRREMQERVPAIVHIDGTARIQSVNVNSGLGVLYRVLELFDKKTSVPIICNTSLNDKGEPIINTLAEAMNFALRKKIKILYWNSYRLLLTNHDEYNKKTVASRKIFPIHEMSEALQKEKNPHGIDGFTMDMYLSFNKLYHRYNLKNRQDVRMLNIEARMMDNTEMTNRGY